MKVEDGFTKYLDEQISQHGEDSEVSKVLLMVKVSYQIRMGKKRSEKK